jgi:hypothetical protein
VQTSVAAVSDVLPRWRAPFPALQEAVAALEFSLITAEASDAPLPAARSGWRF